MDAVEQADYQVRLEWGSEGLARLAPADVVVLVDVLTTDDDGDGGARGPADVARLAELAEAGGAVVLRGALTNAAAVADACLALQHERGARTSVAVIAAGTPSAPTPTPHSRDRSAGAETEPPGIGLDADASVSADHRAVGAAAEKGGGVWFAVEDLLGAGAVLAALAERGTDHSSPEAAVACEAFAGLRRAVVHLVSASVTGRTLAAAGRDAEVAAAARLDSTTLVPRWNHGAWSEGSPSE